MARIGRPHSGRHCAIHHPANQDFTPSHQARRPRMPPVPAHFHVTQPYRSHEEGTSAPAPAPLHVHPRRVARPRRDIAASGVVRPGWYVRGGTSGAARPGRHVRSSTSAGGHTTTVVARHSGRKARALASSLHSLSRPRAKTGFGGRGRLRGRASSWHRRRRQRVTRRRHSPGRPPGRPPGCPASGARASR